MDAIQLELAKDLENISLAKKKEKTILFFGRDSFSDNCKYLYLYMNEHLKDFRVIWCSNNEKTINTLKKNGLPCLLISEDPKATCALFIEAAISIHCVNPIESTAGNILFLSCLKGSISIQLWHGISVKKLDLALTKSLDLLNINVTKSLTSVCLPDYYLSPSEITDTAWNDFFSAKNIIRAGYPRNEVMLRPARRQELIGSNLDDAIHQELYYSATKKILLAPTHENNAGLNNAEIITSLLKYCKDRKINIFIKKHPFAREDIITNNKIGNLFHIPSSLDIYPHLSQFDALVTDYSSIMFDFLTTNKPIITTEDQKTARFDFSLLGNTTDFRYKFSHENLKEIFDTALFNDHMSKSRESAYCDLFTSKALNASKDISDKIIEIYKNRAGNREKHLVF